MLGAGKNPETQMEELDYAASIWQTWSQGLLRDGRSWRRSIKARGAKGGGRVKAAQR